MTTIHWTYAVRASPDAGELALDGTAELEDTPTAYEVTVSNGVAGESVLLSWSGPEGFITDDFDPVVLDDDGQYIAEVDLPAGDAGTYQLTATGSESGTAMLDIAVLNDPLDDGDDSDDGPTLPDPEDIDSTTHWQLIDRTTGLRERYTFPHNPATWTNPARENVLEHVNTVAPDGAILAYQGAYRSWQWQFAGYLDTPEHYAALQAWTEKNRRFWLRDHRGELHYVTFTAFDARARIVPNKPWAHDFTVSVVNFYRDSFTAANDA